mmetsp:Transcript_345/g.705  ORF Transcript_345/g.705 Transcript_345/m.705 type:complete len:256 (-) Transcript_345:88-855(-)
MAAVLVHGLLGWGGKVATRLVHGWTYFHHIEAHLRRRGLRVLAPSLGNGPPAVRAARLLEAVHAWEERRPHERVTLVGHSQGGLDARWALSQLDGAGVAHTLITIGTPHRGSSLCDALLTPALERSPALERTLARANIQTDAARFLSRAYVEGHFNPSCPDSPDVSYLSIAGSRSGRMQYWAPFVPTNVILNRIEGENDGLVSIRSAKWGTYVGKFELDHIEMINYPLKFQRAEPWDMWDKVAKLCQEASPTNEG